MSEDKPRTIKDMVSDDGWIYERGSRRRPNLDGGYRVKDFDLSYRSPDWLSSEVSGKTVRGMPCFRNWSYADWAVGKIGSQETYVVKNMHLSENGFEFITGPSHEGFSTTLYPDQAGHCTIGYGHLVHYGPCSGEPSEDPFLDGITKEEAKKLFMKDIIKYENRVKKVINVKLTQNQFDALVSFAYNLGKVHAPIANAINNGNLYEADGACEHMLQYNKARINGVLKISNGLDRRRKDEVKLFKS